MITTRILCWVAGHRWETIAVDWERHVNLVHLCTRAGFHEHCTRCGLVWNDLRGNMGPLESRPSPLPRATVRR